MKQRQLPFGYALQQGQTLQDKKEAGAIQWIFNAYIEGASYLALARTLSAEGPPYHKGKPEWNKHMVKRILENRRYLGTDKYPAIISKETYLLAGNIRGEKNRPATEPASVKTMRKSAVCTICGSGLKRHTKK